MRKYEIMCVFVPQVEDFSEGLTTVKSKISELEGSIEREEDMGVKELAYTIKKHTSARFLYFIVLMTPQKAHQVRKSVAYIKHLLRILVIHRKT